MNRLGFFTILTLIALRLCIGWHFYKEGSDKIRSGKWTAAGFLGGATGPLADYYHDMVWDRDGSFRLDAAKTAEAWRAAADALERDYGLAGEKEKIEQILQTHQQQLAYVMEEHATYIEEFKLGRERVESLANDETRNKVASLRGQRDAIEGEWKGKGYKALKHVDQVWENLEKAFNDLLAETSTSTKPFVLNKPRLGFMDTTLIDRIIPYFDLSVGISLILGLFVRPFAFAAGLFLISVVFSQFPGWPGAQPTYYQAIEAAACMFLAFIGAGHFGGLDFVLAGWRGKKAEAKAQAKATAK